MKNKIQYLFVIIGFIVSISIFLFDSSLILNKIVVNKNVETIIKQRYIRLLDSYDSNSSSIYDFFDSSDSLMIMDDLYNNLKKEVNLDYYVIDNQNLEYIGDYSHNFGNQIEFVVDNDIELINQKIENDVIITPLKSIQLDYSCMKEIKLDNFMETGEFFEEDISLDENSMLPVIVGYNYRDICKVGDIFKAYYLGEKVITCKVIGILETNCYVKSESPFVNIFDNLIEEKKFDNYIIIPSFTFELKNQEDKYFNDILNCQRCEGYILIDSEKDYFNKLNVINSLSRSSEFKYNLENIVEPIYQKMGFENYMLIVMMIGAISVFIIVFILISVMLKTVICNKQIEKVCLLETSNFIFNICIINVVSYVISYYINASVFLKDYIEQLNKVVVLCVISISLCTTIHLVINYVFFTKTCRKRDQIK